MNYEKYEADREAAAAAFEEVKAVFSERIQQLISSIYAVASERLPPFISSVYDFLFKPIEFITAIIRRDKAYFGIESPSKLLAGKISNFYYFFTIGRQQAMLEQIERVFAPYEIKREIHAPQYKPLADVVAAFNYSKYLYEYYND